MNLQNDKNLLGRLYSKYLCFQEYVNHRSDGETSLFTEKECQKKRKSQKYEKKSSVFCRKKFCHLGRTQRSVGHYQLDIKFLLNFQIQVCILVRKKILKK